MPAAASVLGRYGFSHARNVPLSHLQVGDMALKALVDVFDPTYEQVIEYADAYDRRLKEREADLCS